MNPWDWTMSNSGGSALGSPGNALGSAGSALRPNASLGSIGSFFGGPAQTSKYSLLGPAATADKFSLTGAASAPQYGLDMSKGAGKAGGLKNLSGMDMASMGVGAATAAGIPQMLFGRTAGNALGQGASGALTGMAMGGPVGAGVGGGLGLLSSLLGGGGQRPRPNVPTMPFGDE